MGNRRLREADASFNISCAKAWSRGSSFLASGFGVSLALFQSMKDSAPRWIGNGVQSTVERSV